jgi:hypothetical protein
VPQQPPVLQLPDPPRLRDGRVDSLDLIRYLEAVDAYLRRLGRHQNSSYESSSDHGSSHDADGSDPLTAPSAPVTILPDSTASAGDGPAYAYEDHTHAITTAVAGTIQPDDVAAEGVATSFSRSDHKHAIVAAAPSATGTANSEGASTSFSRADHVHLTGIVTGKGQILTHSATVPAAQAAGVFPERVVYDANQTNGLLNAKPWWPWGYKTLTSGAAATIDTHKGLGAATASASGVVRGKVWANDATTSQVRLYELWWTAVSDAAGALTINTTATAGLPASLTAGTLTVSLAAVDDAANDQILIQLTATTSIVTPVSLETEFEAQHFDYNDTTMAL